MQTVTLPALLTKEDIAAYFGVSIRTVEAWCYHDRGPKPVKIGKHLRWSASSVLAWVESQEGAVA